ncbi:MAG TPA: hypothetical protein VIT45_15750 [Allosphingosinicella sp.]
MKTATGSAATAILLIAAFAGASASAQPAPPPPLPRCEPGERGSATERLGCADPGAVADAATAALGAKALIKVEDGVPGVTVRVTMPPPVGSVRNPDRGQYPPVAPWAVAARTAAFECGKRGLPAGHFNGHHSADHEIVYLICSVSGAVWRDAAAAEIASTPWGFSDVNSVSWAQAGRAAEQLCARANQGFSGGQFNGHQLNGKYGLTCYGEGARWFDATDAELAATGFGFATPRLDDVPWAQAMRAATNFCVGKGFDGGFMNGHQAPGRYGVVCQK